MKKLLVITALLTGGLLLANDAAPEKEKPAEVAKPVVQPPGNPDRGRRGPMQMQENIIKRMRENAAALLKKYDADGDGKLNEAEKAALEKDMKLVEELFPLSVTYKRMQVIDKDGDLVISDAEAANIDMEAIRQNLERARGGMRPERPNRPMPRNPGANRPQNPPAAEKPAAE